MPGKKSEIRIAKHETKSNQKKFETGCRPGWRIQSFGLVSGFGFRFSIFAKQALHFVKEIRRHE